MTNESKVVVKNLFTTLVMGIVLVAGNAFGQEKPLMVKDTRPSGVLLAPVDVETGAVEKIIRNYLLNNPTVIRDAMQALAAFEQKEKQERATAAMAELKTDIYSDPASPIGGNSSGDVTVVVFFDYYCGYCRKTLPNLQTLAANDPHVRIIYKEFPIMGPQSFSAAKAALAAARQGKYVEFHNALFASETSGDDAIPEIAKRLGLNYANLQKDMADPKLDEELDRNQRLAGALDLNGTPAYIIGDQIVPGAIDEASLEIMVKSQRLKLINANTNNARTGGQ